jgi:antitoxin component of MazEF toxin-antitoxin module
MITTIRRSGNSFIIRVPREEMARLGVEVDEYVQVDIRPVEIRPKLPPDVQATVDTLIEKPEVAAAFARLANA